MRVHHWPYTYLFAQPAGTSRGVLRQKEAHFLEVRGEHRGVPFRGIGECGLLRGLSFDDRPDYGDRLDELVQQMNGWSNEAWDDVWGQEGRVPDSFYEQWSRWPSLQFAAEQALRSAYRNRNGHHASDLWDTPWTRLDRGIPTNGLVWMGTSCAMSEALDDKLRVGYACVKMKIGALAWEEERALLQDFRQSAQGQNVELRVDANGAFREHNVEEVLRTLADLRVHSIEQPLPASDRAGLAYWSQHSPVPVALDESLIGLVTPEERNDLLDEVRPPYVVLKPSFVGGWRGTQDWIERAEARGMGWWITSALEGSIGLNAVAQDVARRAPLARAQGLGTGGLYTNNLPPWTELRGEQLHYTAPYPAEVGCGPWPENLRIHPLTDPQLIQETQAFLSAWYGPSDRLEFTTSGSTGTPKTVRLPKKLLVASARATLDTLNLAPGYTSLLALSPTRIGGAMVLIRALVGQGTVDLASVQRNPLEGWDTPNAPWDFCSLVPQQALALAESAAMHTGVKNHPNRFKTLLLGGAHCTPADARRIAPLAQQTYLGFGMTETASHIALAKLQPDNPHCCTPDGRWIYTPVRGVSLVWPQSATEIPSLEPVPLTFAAPHLGLEEPLETTDAVLPNGAGFVWCGRLDGALNSAGVKIFPEQVELWVGQLLPNLEGRGFLTAVADPHWGDRLVWLSEPLTVQENTEFQNALLELRHEHPHWVPKSTGELAEWPRAAQGKIDRAGLRRAAEHASASGQLTPLELPPHG
jgi:hypothetical protein